MKRKSGMKVIATSLLGLGIVLGSSTTQAMVELEVEGGITKKEDVRVEEDDYGSVIIKESSVWEGNMELNTGSYGDVEIIEESEWKGDLKANEASSHVMMVDSTWTGNLISDNDPDAMNQSFVGLQHSQWTGDFSTKNSDAILYAYDHSLYNGNISVSEGNTSIGLEGNSIWQGNLRGSSEERDQFFGIFLGEGSLWEGDATISSSTVDGFSGVDVELDGGAQWKGNLESNSSETSYGYSYIGIQNSSSWIGNAALKEGSFLASIAVSSHWNGNVSLEALSSEVDYNEVNIYMTENSSWQGDLYVNRVGAPCVCGASVNVTAMDNSQWIGNATLAGSVFLHANVMNHSQWIGDVDFTQTKMNPEESDSVGMIDLCGNSLWEGKIISAKNTADVSMTNSTWNMTDSSQTHHFMAEESTISFVENPGRFSTLTVQACAEINDSLLLMNTDLAANQGDLLKVQGPLFGHNNKIEVNNQGSAWVNVEQELTIVETGGSESDAFSLTRPVEVGAFQYNLKQVGNNWNLYSSGRLTSTAEGAMNLVGGSYLLNYAETQTLLQRMGDLRSSDQKQGVWARLYGGEFTSSSKKMLQGFEMSYTGIQIGRDKKFHLSDEKGDIYFGGMFGYSKGSLEYDSGSGNVDSKTLGLYGTYIHPKGFYVDTVLKYNKMKNDYKVLDTAGMGVKGEDINTDGIHFSVEVGKRFHFDQQKREGWYAEPQVQLSLGRTTGGDFTASNGLRVHVDDYNSVLGRVGMNVGYEVKGGKNPINVYGKLSYVHEFDGDVGYRFNGISVGDSFGDSWLVYGIGVTAKFGKNRHLYLDVERASGGKFNQPWAVNGGYRFSW